MQIEKPSKLMLCLGREARGNSSEAVCRDKVEDMYSVLTKIQSKNLMLVELLVYMIEKGFIQNSHKVHAFMDVYNRVKYSTPQQNETNKGSQDDEEKFTKKKFVQALQEICKIVYPSDPKAYKQVLYHRLGSNELNSDIRIRTDEARKYLLKDVIEVLREYDRDLEIVFETYLPENYNESMNFSWQEIRLINKKLPIISLFKFLWEAEICPVHIPPSSFFEITSKVIPPVLTLKNPNHKEGFFYALENVINYAKDAASLRKIKTNQGDIGLTFFDLQMVLVRLSLELTKEKNDYAHCLRNLLSLIGLREVIAAKGFGKGKTTQFQDSIRHYYEKNRKTRKADLQIRKSGTKVKIEQILETNQEDEVLNSSRQFANQQISPSDFLCLKRSLDDEQLPVIPPPQVVEKENDCKYDVEKKHIVIGEQLPKIAQKNKTAAPKKGDKKEGPAHRFKMQDILQSNFSPNSFSEIKGPQKVRKCNQFPVILTEVIYPSDIPNIYIPPKAEIYLETTYIQLAEKDYQKAYCNYCKARSICENSKNQLLDYYFCLLEAQIYEAAGRDGQALLCFHKAKQISIAMPNKEPIILAIVYHSLAVCLYHLEEYEYAFRCLLKSKQIREQFLKVESVENAILQNNFGCCLMITQRNTEAIRHFELSHSIFDLLLGRRNEKTMIVQQNQAKNKKAYIEYAPAFKTMWKTYTEKPMGKNSQTAKTKKK